MELAKFKMHFQESWSDYNPQPHWRSIVHDHMLSNKLTTFPALDGIQLGEQPYFCWITWAYCLLPLQTTLEVDVTNNASFEFSSVRALLNDKRTSLLLQSRLVANELAPPGILVRVNGTAGKVTQGRQSARRIKMILPLSEATISRWTTSAYEETSGASEREEYLSTEMSLPVT